MNKKIIITIGVVAILVIAIVFFINQEKDYTGTPLEPIEKLVKIQYFGEETHEEYKALFTNPEGAMKENQLENFRQSSKPEDTFEYGAEDPKQVMKHMKFIEDNDNLGKVYYLKDVKDTSGLEELSYWSVEKIGEEWKIKNN